MMRVSDRCDLVQDITTDCSVVASLSAAAKMLLGQHAVLLFLQCTSFYRKLYSDQALPPFGHKSTTNSCQIRFFRL